MEWVAVSSSRGSSWPRDWSHVSYGSCTAGFSTTEPSRPLGHRKNARCLSISTFKLHPRAPLFFLYSLFQLLLYEVCILPVRESLRCPAVTVSVAAAATCLSATILFTFLPSWCRSTLLGLSGENTLFLSLFFLPSFPSPSFLLPFFQWDGSCFLLYERILCLVPGSFQLYLLMRRCLDGYQTPGFSPGFV